MLRLVSSLPQPLPQRDERKVSCRILRRGAHDIVNMPCGGARISVKSVGADRERSSHERRIRYKRRGDTTTPPGSNKQQENEPEASHTIGILAICSVEANPSDFRRSGISAREPAQQTARASASSRPSNLGGALAAQKSLWRTSENRNTDPRS